MNVLVAYASKTGTTQRAAAQLAERITQGGAKAELVDLAVAAPDCAAYDAVAIGSSIRMGLLHRSAKKYIAANADKLQSLPVGFFCCRCGKDDTRAVLTAQIGAPLMAHASAAASFGGELNPALQKGFDRIVVAIVSKSDQSGAMQADGINAERIASFADTLLTAARA